MCFVERERRAAAAAAAAAARKWLSRRNDECSDWGGMMGWWDLRFLVRKKRVEECGVKNVFNSICFYLCQDNK